jgi:hypothetical protein
MLQWPSRGNFCVQEEQWNFAEGPKLASKQKCVQDNSGIFADERDNSRIPTIVVVQCSRLNAMEFSVVIDCHIFSDQDDEI